MPTLYAPPNRFRFAKWMSVTGWLIASFTCAAPAPAALYSFTKIAGTSSGFTTLNTNPRINNSGQVAFYAGLGDGTTSALVGSGGLLTTIANSSGPLAFSILSGSVAAAGINDDGVVAFPAALDSSPTVPILVKGSGGSVTTVYNSGTTVFSSFGSGTAINSSETLAFYAILDSGGGEGAFTGSGGPHSTIATSAGAPYGPFHPYPSLNNAGVVSFRAALDGGGGAGAVAKGSGGAITTIAATTDPVVSFLFGYTDINELGQVVFTGTRDSGGTAVFVGDGSGSPVEFASTDDGFASFTGEVAINDLGNVVFKGSPGGAAAIYDGPDPLLSKVVGSGTEVEPGVFVSSVTLSNMSLNNSGSFTFHSMLVGGGEAIYRADIIVVPEPAAFRSITAVVAAVVVLSFIQRAFLQLRSHTGR